KSMAKPRNELLARCPEGTDDLIARLFDGFATIDELLDVHINFNGLLACAAMYVTKHVQRRCHGVVQTDSASRGHARNGDGGGLGTTIPASHPCRLEQWRWLLRGQPASTHQPQHLREAYAPDQTLG